LSLNEPDRAEVLVWTVGTGGGHRSVAEALVQALTTRGQGRVRVAVDDPTEARIGRTARSLARAYGPLVRTSPALWGLLFRGFSRRQFSSGLDRFLLHQLVPAMSERTRIRSPRVVVNCHPLLGPAAHAAAAADPTDSPPALVTVMTDLVGGHLSWLSPRPDAILTATSQASEWCLRHGLPANLVHQTGLPIDPSLASGPAGPEERRELRRRLGLNLDSLCVLIGGGAEGAGHLKRLASWVDSSGLPVQVVVACGNNRRLLSWLQLHPGLVPTVALGFQPSLTPWLRAADVYLGKAGPSTLAEAAAVGLALLVTDALPGQEEDNDTAVVAAGAARRIQSRAGLLEDLARLARREDPLLGELRRGALLWARPDAADQAAEVILSFLDGARPGAVRLPPGRTATG